jgi:hypothetical protein
MVLIVRKKKRNRKISLGWEGRLVVLIFYFFMHAAALPP